MQFSIERIQTEEAFFSLKDEWNPLLEQSAANNIFLTWEWISTWWAYFGKKSQPYIFIARNLENNKLIGIAPLHIHTKKIKDLFLPHRALAFIGTNNAAPDHLDFIVHPDHEDDIKQHFIAAIQTAKVEWDILDLDGLRGNSSIVSLLTDQTPGKRCFLERIESATIQLPDSWEEMESALGKNLRYNIRRYDRKMEKEHPEQVCYQQIKHEETIEKTLTTLLDYGATVRKKHGEKHTLANQQMRLFHQDLAKSFLEKNWLRLYTLDIEEKSIAALYCYAYNTKVFYYQTGYDLAWSQYGPGRQILAHGVRQAIAEQANEFDFLRGEHAYKEDWANATNTDYVLKVAYSLYGQGIVQIYKMVRGIKKRLAKATQK